MTIPMKHSSECSGLACVCDTQWVVDIYARKVEVCMQLNFCIHNTTSFVEQFNELCRCVNFMHFTMCVIKTQPRMVMRCTKNPIPFICG